MSSAVKLCSTSAKLGSSWRKAAVISSATPRARSESTQRHISPAVSGLICEPCPAITRAVFTVAFPLHAQRFGVRGNSQNLVTQRINADTRHKIAKCFAGIVHVPEQGQHWAQARHPFFGRYKV